jgi:probable HAF family extracellular repeat protein
VHPEHAFLYDSGTLTDFGTLGGPTSEGLAINASGQIVGQADVAANQPHAFVTSSGTLQDLGTLGGPRSSAVAINDPGVIVGTSDLPNAAGTVAFIYNGTMTSLGTLGGNSSSPFALNNSAVVVGQSTTAGGATHAFVYSNAPMFDLGTLGGNYSAAFAINDAGLIVGESSDTNSDTHGFVYSGGVMTDLGTFGGTMSTAYLVNSNGQAIGYASIPGDLDFHGLFYSNGTVTDLGTLGGTTSFADGINNLGQVVGDALTATGDDHAFLWQNGQMTDLNTLLPANSDFVLQIAIYINDAGRIVGTGTNLDGSIIWFIMDLGTGGNPPVANAGPNQTVDCQTQVTLDGSASTGSQPLSFVWTSGSSVLGTTPQLSVSLPLGSNIVTLKVTDSCGASSETNITIVVADNTPPKGSCPADLTVSADSHCQALVPNFASQVVASDNCTPPQSLVITQDLAVGLPVGLGPHPVVITVTDSSGNSSTCKVLFTVVDTTPPVILSAPAPFNLSAGADCQVQVPNVLPNVVASDSCTAVSQLIKTQNPMVGSLIGIGSHTIVVTVTDGAGNTSGTNVILTVSDSTPPTILSSPGPVNVSADANCQGVVPNVLGGIFATDNCTAVSQLVMTQNPKAGAVLPSGQYSIAVTVADASGNTTPVNVPLTIADNTPPTILNSPGPITISADANCQGVVPNVLGGILATDNCTVVSQLVMTQNPKAGTVLPSGQYSIAVTVTDASGNTTPVNVPLIIADTTPPVIQSLAASPSVLSPPNHQLVAVTVSAVVSDNCDPSPVAKIVSITCSEACFPSDIQVTGNLTANLAASKDSSGTTRTYTITVQAADASGNSSTGQVTVAVPKNSSGNNVSSNNRPGEAGVGHSSRGGGDHDGAEDNDRDDVKTRH